MIEVTLLLLTYITTAVIVYLLGDMLAGWWERRPWEDWEGDSFSVMPKETGVDDE